MSLRTAFVVLWIAASLLAPPAAYGEEIPLGKSGNLYTVPAQVNGAIKIDFLVDSGASVVVLPEDVISTLMRSGALTKADYLGVGTSILADGSTRRSARVRLREVRIGERTVKDVVATVSPARSHPLLGQTVLGRFGAVTFDNNRRVLILSDGASVADAAPSRSRSSSYGSFAFAETTGRYGYSWNQGNEANADQAALKGCSSGSCEIVFRTGPRECGAIATPDNGAVWGGAKRPTRTEAERASIENCQRRTDAQCKVRGAECNR